MAGREVRVTNPERPYFPAVGLTKLDVVTYYAGVAPTMLRGLDHRPTTLERWPGGVHPGVTLAQRDGTKGDAFYQKRIPQGAPSYVETAHIAFPSGRTADEVCPTEPAVIAWAANLGTITFHPWPIRRDDVDHPDELRLDFDPQPGTGWPEVVQAALTGKQVLDELGWVCWPKTSGSKGLHVYVRLEPRWTFTEVRHAAIAFGRELERRMPGRVTTAWWKELRGETIFLDYNQNARDRTIAAAWSIRARPHAPVSTPLSWVEVPQIDPQEFTVRTIPDRLAAHGDPHEGIDDIAHDLTPLLAWWDRDEADGAGDLPYPPDYPKMAGEPKRVQPSRDTDRPR